MAIIVEPRGSGSRTMTSAPNRYARAAPGPRRPPAAAYQEAADRTAERLGAADYVPSEVRGMAQRTLERVAQAAESAAVAVSDLDGVARDAAATAFATAKEKATGFLQGAISRYQDLTTRAARDGSITVNEALDIMNALAGVSSGLLDYTQDEVARLFGKLEKLEQKSLAADALATEVPRVAGRLNDVTQLLERQGLVDTGNWMANFRNGKIWINDKPVDFRAWALGLVTLREAVFQEEQSDDETFTDRLFSEATPAEFDFTIGLIGVDAVSGLGGLVYDEDLMTHVETPLGANNSGTSVREIASVFPGLVTGTRFPLTGTLADGTVGFPSAGFRVSRKKRIRASHTSTGLLTVLATAGIQSFQNGFAQAIPAFSNSLKALLNMDGGADVVTRP